MAHSITPLPGAITIGWRDHSGVQHDTPITAQQVLATDALRRAIAHLGVEVGRKKARRAAWMLGRRLRNLAQQAEKRGEYLQLHTRGQTTAPSPYDSINGLGLEVRAIRDHLIRWDIAIYSAEEGSRRQYSYRWRVLPGLRPERHDDVPYRYAADAATLIRRAVTYFPVGYTADGHAIWSR